jgi:putative nucleotidyltransferase with HDIG domain
MLCVPLVFSGRNLGVLVVLNKREGGFTDADKGMLQSMAVHAAASIYRNRVMDDMKSDFVNVLDILVAAMDNHVPEKKGHAKRVARYAVKLAKGMGLNEEEQRRVYFGALLHDVGVLKLDLVASRDKEVFRAHSALGAEAVKNIHQWREVADIIRDHHERYDGTGYPGGLSGPDISLGGRIVAVAEAFDVMTSPNSYKPSISFDEAAEEIRTLAGMQFDPEVARVFRESFSEDDVEGFVARAA